MQRNETDYSMDNELEGDIYDIKWTKVVENKARRWAFVMMMMMMMMMNSNLRKGTWQAVTVRISPVVAWNLIWTLLVRTTFSFHISTKHTYNIYDTIVTSLRHVSLCRCHFQGVRTQLTAKWLQRHKCCNCISDSWYIEKKIMVQNARGKYFTTGTLHVCDSHDVTMFC